MAGLAPLSTAVNASEAIAPSAVNSAVQGIGQYNSSLQVPTNYAPQALGNGGTGTVAGAGPSDLASFFHFLGAAAPEAGHLVESAAEWSGRQAITAVKGTLNMVPSTIDLGKDAFDTYSLQNQMKQSMDARDQLDMNLKQGRINLTTYNNELKAWNKQNQDLITKTSELNTKTQTDNKSLMQNSIDTASLILAIGTDGISSVLAKGADAGAVDAATFAASDDASPIFKGVETTIENLSKAGGKDTFYALPNSMQAAIKSSVTDSLLNTSVSKTASQIARQTAMNMAFKFPLEFNMLSGTGKQLYNDLETGDFGGAVMQVGFFGGMILGGGPIGKAFEELGKGLGYAGKQVFGELSFTDTLSSMIGNGDSTELARIVANDGERGAKAMGALETTNLKPVNGRVTSGVMRVVNGLTQAGWDLKSMTHQQVYEDMLNWQEANSALREDLMKGGMSEADAQKYTVGRYGSQERSDIIDKVGAVENGTKEQMLNAWDEYKVTHPNTAAANNDNLDQFIKTSIKKAGPENFREAILSMPTQAARVTDVSDEVSQAIAKKGYVPITPSHIVAPYTEATGKSITSSVEAVSSGLFQKAVQPMPVLKEMGTMLTKMGLSPMRAQQTVNEIFSEHLAANLNESTILKDINDKGMKDATLKALKVSADDVESDIPGVSTKDEAFLKSQGIDGATLKGMFKEAQVVGTTTKGEDVAQIARENYKPKDATYITQKLNNYINKINANNTLRSHLAIPITDMRQLTSIEIMKALGIEDISATHEIMGAINDAMLSVPLSIRGAGDRIMDYAYAKAGGIVSRYTRIQGAGRFAWNPFFKVKLAYKSEFLAQMEAGGKLPNFLGTRTVMGYIFRDQTFQYRQVGDMLEKLGFFTGGFGNEGADEAAARLVGSNPSGLLKSQKESIGGLVSAQASKMGMQPEEFIHNFPQQTRDTIEAIIHYDPNSSFLNSPMTRTLNMIVFPFRFNVKVSTAIVKVLVKQTPLMQTALIYGGLQAHQFLTSAEGQAWYSQYSEVIGLLEYVSPLETLSAISALGDIKNDSIGALGELGGLPFGFVTQILDAEGITNVGQAPYVNAQTGIPGTNYIPNTQRAQLAQAISSFLGSLFTYPGAEAGLPSKTKALSDIAQGSTGTSSSQWTAEPETNLTPQEQSFSQAVQNLHGAQTPTPQPIQPTQQSSSIPPTPPPLPKALQSAFVKKANEPVSPQYDTAAPGPP